MLSSTSSSDGGRTTWGSRVPLIEDVRQDRTRVRQRIKRLALFLALLLAVDFGVSRLLLAGVERYFGLDDKAELLVVGHSHTVLGIDKIGLEQDMGLRVAKYAQQGANIADRAAMVRHYLSRHPDAVEAVVFGVDAHMFTQEGLSSNSYQLFLPFLDDAVISTYLKGLGMRPMDSLVRGILKTSRFSEPTIGFAVRGLLGDWSNYKYGQVDLDRLRKQLASGDYRKIKLNPSAIEAFEAMLEVLERRRIQVVLAFFPTIDLLNGADPDGFAEVVQRLGSYAAQGENVVFLDYNEHYQARHELFFDPVHLNQRGQQIITAHLGADLKTLFGDNIKLVGR